MTGITCSDGEQLENGDWVVPKGAFCKANCDEGLRSDFLKINTACTDDPYRIFGNSLNKLFESQLLTFQSMVKACHLCIIFMHPNGCNGLQIIDWMVKFLDFTRPKVAGLAPNLTPLTYTKRKNGQKCLQNEGRR